MNMATNSFIRKTAVTAAAALTMLAATMSPASANEPMLQVDRSAHVQPKAAPKCATGTLTPSGTHCYLPAVVSPATR